MTPITALRKSIEYNMPVLFDIKGVIFEVELRERLCNIGTDSKVKKEFKIIIRKHYDHDFSLNIYSEFEDIEYNFGKLVQALDSIVNISE